MIRIESIVNIFCTQNSILLAWTAVFVSAVVFISVTGASGQRIAVIVPQPNETADLFADAVSDSLRKHAQVIDRDLADQAFRSTATADPFNQPTSDARRIGLVVGTDHFVLIRAATQLRSSFVKDRYFEAFAAIYLVNSRSGRLDHFQLESKTAETEADAAAKLVLSAEIVANQIAEKADEAGEAISKPKLTSQFPEYPADNDPQKTGLRPPMPFKRIKPEYTPLAFTYEVTATVDVEVSIDAKGEVAEAETVRWAGYGLDDSVLAAVRAMNWRAGESKGTALPMRVLLRYNFKKIEKEDQ